MNYSPEALGLVVRELREARSPRLTQRELGVRAGYGEAGAGVAISRIESGLSRPSPGRLAGLNAALDLFPGELETLAARRTEELAASTGGSAVASDESLRHRLLRLQRTVEERTQRLSSTVDAFNEAHDKARDEFFLPFVRAAEAISGAPAPPRESLEETVPEEGADAEATAAFRLHFASYGVAQALSGAAAGAAVGGAAGAATAYAAFTAAVTWGTASTGVAISGLSGVAASNAALALLGGGTLAAGGAGIAGGSALLTGLVAGPAVLLALGGVVWAARRNRQQRQELKAKLGEAEAQLDAQARGVQAFIDLVRRAAQILEYIAVHGAHARERWSRRLEAPTEWDALSPVQQEQYDDFVQLCAAQLAVATLDVERLLVLRGEELDQEIGLMDQILEKSEDLVYSRA
ncbi:helix-turn-helix domain-containing protein [Geodermatophilus sp. SYSU D00804]